MRHAPLCLALAFALVSGACNDRGGGSDKDAAAQEDANVHFDVNVQQDSAQHDVMPQADAPPANHDSGTSLVKCGSSYCNLANNEECCVSGTTLDCQAKGTCAGYGTLTCDGPEDCYESAAPVCCGAVNGTGGGTSCQSSCTGSGAMVLCHGDATCGSGQRCCGSFQLGGLDVQYCLAEADCAATPADPGVPCGTGVVCNAPDVCCLSQTPGCMLASSCTQGFAQACDGPEDCQQDGGTQVCCANADMNGGAAVCVATCTQTGLLSGVLCHSDADCTSPATCKTLSIMGYSIRRCN